jgi:hypothetical protein
VDVSKLITISMKWRFRNQEGGQEVFTSAANEFINRLQDKAPLWRAISRNVLQPAIQEQFATEGAAGAGSPSSLESSGSWDELADATIKKRGSAHPILHDEGRLEESFTEGGEGHFEEFGPESGEWGSTITDKRGRGYAPYHQTGTSRMPAREILFWNERMSLLAEAEVQKFGIQAASGIFTINGQEFYTVSSM